MLIYIYDLIFKDQKSNNTIKRRFYYNLNKKFRDIFERKTKSTIAIPEKFEKKLDEFFFEFEGFIKVYKIRTSSIEKLLEVTPLSSL